MFLRSRSPANHLFFNTILPKTPVRSIVSWADLRGTYNALPKDWKHFSPLCGAIFRHTKGIDSLYKRASIVAKIDPKYKSATFDLVTSLFHDDGTQFRNTHLKSHPAFSLTPELLADIIIYLNTKEIDSHSKRDQIFKSWKAQHCEITGHVPSNKQINALLDVMVASKKEANEYPYGLTETILLSYLDYKSSSLQDLKTYLIGLQKNGLEIDLPALSRAEKANDNIPETINKMAESDYPHFINEKFEDIILHLTSESSLDKVLGSHFGYQGQPRKANCVEVSFHNLCNIIFFNEKSNQFDFSLVPQKPNEALCAIYDKNSFTTNNVNQSDIGQAFMDMLSGQDRFIYASGNYELESTVKNFIPVMNFLFNGNAKTLKGLSSHLSSDARQIIFSKNAKDEIKIQINSASKQNEIIFIFRDRSHAYLKTDLLDNKGSRYLFYPDSFLAFVEKNMVHFPLLFSMLGKRNIKKGCISPEIIPHLSIFYFPQTLGAAYDLFTCFISLEPQLLKCESYFILILKSFPDLLGHIARGFLLGGVKREQFKIVDHAILTLIDADNGNALYRNEALYFACRFNRVDFIQRLLEKCVDINLFNGGKKFLMHIASKNGSLDIVKLLIQKGANINVENDSKETPLHLACAYGRLGVVKLLLEAGADFNVMDAKNKTPFDYAYVNERHEIMKVLIEVGAKVDEGRDLSRSITPR